MMPEKTKPEVERSDAYNAPTLARTQIAAGHTLSLALSVILLVPVSPLCRTLARLVPQVFALETEGHSVRRVNCDVNVGSF